MHANEPSRFQTYALTIQLLLREWVPYLKPIEALVVLFIADRTAGWGKESEEITHRHFLEGIRDRKNGTVYAGALPLSHPPLIAALRHLTALGAISATKGRKRTTYALNLDWNPYPENQTMALPTPKRLLNLQTLQSTEGKGSLPLIGKGSLPSEGKGSLPYKKRKLKKGKIEEGNPSDSHRAGEENSDSGELSSAISYARGRAVSRRKAKVDRWSALSAPTAWIDLCRLHSVAGFAALTVADGCVLHQYGKKWMKAHSAPVADWLAFLGWVVGRWPAIMAEHFSWAKPAPPAIPSLRFLLKLSDRFEMAWHGRAALEMKAGMTTRERELAALMAKGMDKEVAERDVDSRLGLTRQREGLEKAARELKRQREHADNDALRRQDADARNAKWKERAARTNDLDLSEGAFDPWS